MSFPLFSLKLKKKGWAVGIYIFIQNPTKYMTLMSTREKLAICDVTNLPYIWIKTDNLFPYMVILWRHWPHTIRVRILSGVGWWVPSNLPKSHFVIMVSIRRAFNTPSAIIGFNEILWFFELKYNYIKTNKNWKHHIFIKSPSETVIFFRF